MEEFSDISQSLKRNVILDYLVNIRIKVVVNKKKSISIMKARNDQQMIKIS